MINKIIFNGILEYDKNGEYIINENNLSNTLYKLYMKEIPAIYSIFIDGKLYVSDECVLQKRHYKRLLWDYFAEDVNIENKLFNAVGKQVEIEITIGEGF